MCSGPGKKRRMPLHLTTTVNIEVCKVENKSTIILLDDRKRKKSHIYGLVAVVIKS